MAIEATIAGRCTHLKPFKRTKLGPELYEHVCRMMDWLQQEFWNSPCLVQRKDRQLVAFVFSSNWHGERKASEDITAHADEYSFRPKREDTSDCNLSGVIKVSEFSRRKKTTKTLCKYRCMTYNELINSVNHPDKRKYFQPRSRYLQILTLNPQECDLSSRFFTFLHYVTDMKHALIFPDEQVVSVWQSATR